MTDTTQEAKEAARKTALHETLTGRIGLWAALNARASMTIGQVRDMAAHLVENLEEDLKTAWAAADNVLGADPAEPDTAAETPITSPPPETPRVPEAPATPVAPDAPADPAADPAADPSAEAQG